MHGGVVCLLSWQLVAGVVWAQFQEGRRCGVYRVTQEHSEESRTVAANPTQWWTPAVVMDGGGNRGMTDRKSSGLQVRRTLAEEEAEG